MFGLFKYLSTALGLCICLISSMTSVYCKFHKCSDIYGENTFGSLGDSCTCNQSSTNVSLLVCREWPSQPFIFEISELEMKVNGLNGTIPFEFLEWFVPLVTSNWSTSIYSLEVSNFCNDPSVISNHLNISNLFHNDQNDTIMVLKMSNNCLQSITSSKNNIRSLKTLDFSFNKLVQFPKLDYPLLSFYDLSHNSINTVSKTDFNFTKDVMFVNLSNNHLTSLPQNILNDLHLLSELNLSHNSISHLHENIFDENKNLEKLDMSYNILTNLSKFIFSNSDKLEVINLSNNKIKYVNLWFGMLNRLKVLRLESNDIIEFKLENPRYEWIYLQQLVLANNSLKALDYLTTKINFYNGINYDVTSNNLTTLRIPLTLYYVPHAKIFDMSNNCFQNYEVDTSVNYPLGAIENYKCSNCCLHDIPQIMFRKITRKVDISFNNITKLDNGILKAFQNIPEIILSHNKINHVNLTQFQAIYQHKNIHFDLSYNPFVCDCRLNKFIKYLKSNQNEIFSFHTENNFCSSPPKLNGTPLVTIRNNLLCDYPKNCPKHCHCYIEDVDKISLVLIDCTNSNLTHFPNIISYGPTVAIQLNLSRNQISSLPSKNDPIWTKIKILDLSNNRIDSIKNMTVLPILTTLYLNNNSLSEFNYQIASLSQVAQLKLANNPLKCDCEMSKLVLNIKSFVIEDKYEMTCLRDKTIHNFTNVDQICISLSAFNWLLLFLPIIIIVILIFVIVILIIKYKSEIVYYMFSKGICLRLVCEEDIDADKVYDAFVSYSSEDEDWITDFLVPGLETGNPTYNLCLHNRDWLGGEFITDQIVKSVKSSRRTIIVLTDNYLKSKWSRLEFDVAYQQGLKDQVRRVMVIIPDEVPDLSQIDPEFKTFITLTTYIQANKPHFWRTLRASMPRTKNICKPSTSTRRTVYLDVSQQLHCEDVATSEL